MNENSEDQAKLSSFRRGNINFDILKPEGVVHVEKLQSKKEKKIVYVKKSKRGQFDLNRKLNPVSARYIFLWAVLFLISLASFIFILADGRSLLWMIALPFILSALLWSVIMMALIKARPR